MASGLLGSMLLSGILSSDSSVIVSNANVYL